jgi:hypothetical protein
MHGGSSDPMKRPLIQSLIRQSVIRRFLIQRSIFLCVLVCVSLAPPLFGRESVHRTCQIRSTTFQGWAAEEISNEWLQLSIVKELGGRLMQVSFAGHPYLFVNPRYKGKYIPPAQANGEWINYGGDKLWPLPEGRGDEQHWAGPASDVLDDGAYDLKVISQAPVCTVRLEGPADPVTGLQYSREIGLRADSPQISFHAVMKNATGHPIRWSMQSVTQYDTSDVRSPAEYNRKFWAFTLINPLSGYFNGYQVRSGLADDPSFAVDGGLFKLHWTFLENEVWLDSIAGWLAVVDADSQFAMVERFQPVKGVDYPGKASLIFYKNGASVQLDENGKPVLRSSEVESTPYYMEAEINSPLVELQPGETCSMDTSWWPTRADGQVRDVLNAAVILSPLAAVASNDSIVLSGAFGVFFPGKLQAHLFDSQGLERQTLDLISVEPQTRVQLRQEVRLSKRPARVSIHLVDDQGIDRGSLGEALVETAAF